MLKYKHIEASREVRLWIRDIMVPMLTAGTVLYTTNQNVKNFIDEKIDDVKTKINEKKHH